MIGSGVPDQLISRGIVYSPGQITITATETYPTPAQKIKSEFDYAAPPVPEPTSIKAYEPTSTFEPEPEFEYAAPPVPEPAIVEKKEPTPIFEPEFEPEIPLPETQIKDSSKQTILSHEKPEQQQYSPSQLTPFTSREETYKPKAIPFTNSIPVPAPTPEQFQSPQEDPSIQSAPSSLASNLAQVDSTDTKSDSLMDYLPEPIYSKKDKKKLEKQKKKEEKEKKLQEEKEKQERLLEEMKHVKKEKKEKTKKEKKEKVELKETLSPITAQPAPTTGTTSAPSLFQTLSQKVDDTEKTPPEAFVPFIADKESEAQEMSKLRIIPNVSDLESKPTTFSPTQTSTQIQPTVPEPSGKEVFICKQCGAILSSDYAFCNKCGSHL